jgi:hypothetical protein
MGYPGSSGSHITLRTFCWRLAGNSDNWGVDPVVIAIVIVVVMPLAVVFALAKAARMRGPALRPESRRPVASLVTEAVPEEHPDDDDVADSGPNFSLDSPPPEPDAGLRGRPD